MCLDAPQLLILDEPTNHLDIESREALIEAINEFPGAVILISHDASLIELAADRLWLVADARVQPYEGDLAEYRALLLAASSGVRTGSAEPASASERLSAAERRSLLAPLRQTVRRAEREIERLGVERAKLEARLAEPATYAGEVDIAGLRRRIDEIEQRVALEEARWLEAGEEIDRLEAA
jgi:ATP-binding cassette subfamily F protein 3